MLPPELTDFIIDLLHDEPASLSTCALVCSRWLARSRINGFATVQLWPWRAAEFFRLLEAPDCTFAPYISRIEFDSNATRPSMVNIPFDRVLKFNSLTRVSNVRVIRLANVDWTTYPIPDQNHIISLLGQFAHLEQLELDSLITHDLHTVVQILSSFPILRHFSAHLRFSKYIEHAVQSAEQLHIPPGLKTVELNSDEGIPVFLACLGAARSLDIHTIRLRNITFDDLPYVRRALDTLGSNLRHFLLSFSRHQNKPIPAADISTALHLSCQTDLRTLHLENIDLTCNGDCIMRPVLPCLLSTITSNVLEDVSLSFRIHSADDLVAMPWSDLEKVFLTHSSLRKVDVDVSFDIGDRSAIEADVLKRMRSVGILRVHATSRRRSMTSTTRPFCDDVH
ncbi:uncharacterized protein EV420DRAFT_1494673 [Desarmillaria tabescens]|uniref:F-box domain-containing protein n=1 Tax=Armillaria tabescens TaxID=1929756 RepID=A0AA39NPJ4_ARMTA|nr:uncharacterized protein EV420DRAFT_1494673 [Desarmillaria tabescens]KAK0469477.1 hypothetical protein EV420DRAFT_1494673 [Desarmillaria tabescens]